MRFAQSKCLDRYLILFGPRWHRVNLTKWPKIQLLAHSSSSTMLSSFAKLSSMRIVLQTFFYWYTSVTFRLRQVLRNMKILCSNSWVFCYFVGENMLNNSNSLPMVCFSLSTTISRRIYNLCERFIWDIYYNNRLDYVNKLNTFIVQ